MSLATMKIEPEFSVLDREELAHLDYFAGRASDLRDRGLISPECYQTIVDENQVRREAVTRRGVYRSALNRAKELAAAKKLCSGPRVGRPRPSSEPEARGAWDLEISLCSLLDRHEEAIAPCTEAAVRFPELAARLDWLRRQQDDREAQERRRAEKELKQPRIAQPIEPTRPRPKASQATASSSTEPESLRPEIRETVARHSPGQASPASFCRSTGKS